MRPVSHDTTCISRENKKRKISIERLPNLLDSFLWTESNRLFLSLIIRLASFAKTKREKPLNGAVPYFFFRVIRRLMIHAIKIAHTITSPNMMINAAPPTLSAIMLKTINAMKMIARIVSRINSIRLLSYKTICIFREYSNAPSIKSSLPTFLMYWFNF